MTQDRSFLEQLTMSSGHAVSASVKDILLREIPGATKVVLSTSAEDRNGTDYWVHLRSGHRLSVDCKVRRSDWAASHPNKDDLALETWSVLDKVRSEFVPVKIGWTRDKDKRTDYILWLWKDTGRWCLVPFALLCAVFCDKWEEWRTTYPPPAPQHTPSPAGDWYSECIFVPRHLVWAEIYKRFGGALKRVAHA